MRGGEHPTIVYLGRLNPHKKVDWLLKALKIVKREVQDVKLNIVGDGPYRFYYENLSRKIGVEKNVLFHKGLDDLDVIKLLKGSRVYVLPSIREGQSITTLEAMAAGTPQIVIDIDGNGAVDLIKTSRSGLIIKPSIKSLADSVMALLNDDILYKRLRDNGFKYIENYSWDNTADSYHKLYTWLVE